MKRRKGRPLLLAAYGVAFVSFACEKPDVITSPSPVGNLRGPEPIPFDAGTIAPEEDSGAPVDAGTTAVPEADIVTAPSPPVGNLRAPDWVVTPKTADAGVKKKPPGKI